MSHFSSTRKRFGAIDISPRGYINAGFNTIKNVKYPTEPDHATNKLYVDRFNNVGDIKLSVKSSDFYGWLKCDGRSLSRTAYAVLFAVIGTSFGSVDSNSFSLPDSRGRVLGTLGQGAGLTNRALGASIGAETHTLTSGEMPVHNHSITDPGHTHTWNHGTEGDDSGNGGSYSEFTQIPGSISNAIESSTTGVTVNNAGDGGAHNNMQPTLFIGHVYIYSGIEVL